MGVLKDSSRPASLNHHAINCFPVTYPQGLYTTRQKYTMHDGYSRPILWPSPVVMPIRMLFPQPR